MVKNLVAGLIYKAIVRHVYVHSYMENIDTHASFRKKHITYSTNLNSRMKMTLDKKEGD